MPVSLAGVDPDGFALGQVLGCLSFNMDQGNAARDVEALSLGVCASAANVTAWAARPASSVAVLQPGVQVTAGSIDTQGSLDGFRATTLAGLVDRRPLVPGVVQIMAGGVDEGGGGFGAASPDPLRT